MRIAGDVEAQQLVRPLSGVVHADARTAHDLRFCIAIVARVLDVQAVAQQVVAVVAPVDAHGAAQ
jgi:hypothetical protein